MVPDAQNFTSGNLSCGNNQGNAPRFTNKGVPLTVKDDLQFFKAELNQNSAITDWLKKLVSVCYVPHTLCTVPYKSISNLMTQSYKKYKLQVTYEKAYQDPICSYLPRPGKGRKNTPTVLTFPSNESTVIIKVSSFYFQMV